MKKSFKKAGAAVLSMAMLLSMGAVSMPAYAAGNTIKPASVEVSINNINTWADDDTHHYEYLDNLANVDSAEVTLYKVAELSDSGWQWEGNLATILAGNGADYAALRAIARDANDNTLSPTLNLTTFEDLLKKIQDSNSQDTDEPLAHSEDLLSLASALERIVTGSGSGVTAIDTQTLNSGSTVTFTDDDIMTNHIGYYLLVTKPDNAGVRVQPSLFVLKNTKDGEDTFYGNNPKQVSVKGVEINIDKRIGSVTDKNSHTSTGGSVVSGSGDTAVVGKDDVIQYIIEAEVPSYDPLLADASIKTFQIIDTPADGIKIYDWDSTNSRADYTNTNMVVYVSATKLNTNDYKTRSDFETAATAGNIKQLTAGTDYTVTATATSSDTDGEGFTVNITGEQMRANGANKTASTDDTMEGEFIYVVFDATVTDQLNRTYLTVQDSETYDDLESTNIQSMTVAQLGAAIVAAGGTVADADNPTDTEISTFLATLDSSALPTAEQVTAMKPASGYSDNETKAIAYFVLKDTNDGIAAANAANAEANGNKNIADMEFGNDYATGQGLGKDEDTTKVYSVDLDLDKKVKKELLESDGAGGWNDAESYEPVAGAVFKLVKCDNSASGAPELASSAKYAVSDANGDLKLIVPTSTYNDTTLTTEVKFTEDGTEQTYYLTAEDAYIELTKGDYKLYEVYTPAGYAKWTAADSLAFTVGAETDAVSGEYTGAFNANATNGAGTAIKDLRTPEQQAITDTTDPNYVAPYYFEFTGAEGQLDGTILNKYADKLPATGGIGTVLFTAGGISVVLIAGALFVMYMKKKNSEDEE